NPSEAFILTHLEDPAVGALAQEKLRFNFGTYYAMTRTTLVPSIIKGGFRINVIPGDALAQIDVRALPDEDVERLADALRKLINDPLIEVVAPVGGRPTAPPSRHDNEMFGALEKAQKRQFPGALTIPLMVVGATDSAQLRAKGVQAYGVGTVYGDKEVTAMHGNDERINIKGLSQFTEFIWHTVLEVAAAKN
ncbi:MAG: peptidase M20, partial [Verrucomicrobia bacterium]|nr:peptidase M20 [Verrucomicrobiota bacterium]